jgi:hypothetical protein
MMNRHNDLFCDRRCQNQPDRPKEKSGMQPVQLQGTYLDLTTPHVADACVRLGIPVRCAPAGTRALWSGTHMVGRVCPARHYGSVDVFLEAIDGSDSGDDLVVDNSGVPTKLASETW